MFRIRCVILLLLSAFCSAFCAGYGQQPTGSPSASSIVSPSASMIASIESMIRSQQYDQALQLTKTGLRQKPADSRLWTLEGIVLSIKGQNQDALAAFDKALHLSPGNPAALRGKVQILYQSQDQRATPLLEQILKATPKDEVAREMLAILKRKAGDCPGAIAQFRLSGQVIETHPDSLEGYGDCLVQAKELEEAVPVFERLVALLPDRVYPKYDLAVVLVGTKKYEAAVKILDPLLDANSSDPDLLSLASEAHEGSGDTPKAVALLRQAIVLDPSNPSYYVAFASLCLDHSSFQVGVDMLNVGLKRIQNDPALYLSRGLLYAQLASYDKAEADFNTAEKLDSAQSLSSYALDLAEIQRNQGDKTLPKIREQLKEHPESPWLHYVLARMIDNKETPADAQSTQEAIQSAQEAVRLKPDFIEARNLLASMYMHAGQYESAIEQCRVVLQADPSDESATYHLLLALRRSGQGDQNKEEIQRLTRSLSDLKQSSLHKEIEKNRYKLVERDAPQGK